MSLLTNATQPNPNSFYFALSGGGAGNLQSPASVTPDGTGTATLSVNANQANGSSAISAQGGSNNSGAVVVGGYGQNYRMGVVAPGGLMPSLPNLEIGLNTTADPCIAYDPGTNVLLLGDNTLSGLVRTNCSTVIFDPNGGPNNGIALAPITPQTSSISQTCASGGVLSFGSSQVNTSGLQVIDAGVANTSAVLAGGNSGNSIILQGGVGSGAPSIHAFVADGGAMTLGSSLSVPDSIFMTDAAGVDNGRTVIKNQVPAAPLGSYTFTLTNGGPVTAGTIPTGTNVLNFVNAGDNVDGLYWIGINCSTSPNLNTNTMAYYSSGTGTWRTGGSAYGVIYSGGNLSFIGGGGNMLLVNSTPGTVNGSVYWVRIFTGAIGI